MTVRRAVACAIAIPVICAVLSYAVIGIVNAWAWYVVIAEAGK